MAVSKFLSELFLRTVSAVFLLAAVIYIWSLGIIWREFLTLILFSFLVLEWILLWGRVTTLKKGELRASILFTIGFIYIFFSGVGFWDFLHHPVYAPLIPGIMLILWTVDSGAYLIGSILKGPKLAPSISAGKTWSGFAGGVLLGHLIGYIFIFHSTAFPDKNTAFIVTFFIPFLAQLGDLLESKAKRILNVKDSSGLIPGHGGILDRLDSALIIFFLWCVYLCLQYLNIAIYL